MHFSAIKRDKVKVLFCIFLRPHVYGKVGISRAKMFEMVGNFVTSVIYIKIYLKQMYLYCMLNVKGLMT